MRESVRIQALNLTKVFGNGKGVFGLDFTLTNGITGFLGRNGSGKTTTMRMLAGLLSPDRGRVMIGNRDLWKFDHIYVLKKRLGFLPNEDFFFPRLTGRENLEYLSLLKTRERDAYRALDARIDDLGVAEYIDDFFGQYSSGMRKKVQLIGALIGQPRCLLLDEPHSGLDVMANITLNRIMTELRDEGRTVFLSSHVAEVFDSIADRVLVIDGGRIVAVHEAPYATRVVELYLEAIGERGVC